MSGRRSRSLDLLRSAALSLGLAGALVALAGCASFAGPPAGAAARPAHAAAAQQPRSHPSAWHSAGRHPDLSGVWTWDLAPGESPFRRGKLELPFTPLAKRKVATYHSLVAGTSDSPGAHCLGSGMPADMMFSGGYPMEIVQSPDLIVVLYEAWSEVRQLYLGDKVIPASDRLPDREGYSVAHWEGQTLVVVTTSLKEQEDQTYPHSAQARIVERYRLTRDAKGGKVLVDDWTLTDPLFYTRPLEAQKKWAFEPKGILLPYECNEEAWLDHLQKLEKAKGLAADTIY
ncbi:MAG: hypothetical protein ACREU3_11830 [Steroidobacteraceae bacterium]